MSWHNDENTPRRPNPQTPSDQTPSDETPDAPHAPGHQPHDSFVVPTPPAAPAYGSPGAYPQNTPGSYPPPPAAPAGSYPPHGGQGQPYGYGGLPPRLDVGAAIGYAWKAVFMYWQPFLLMAAAPLIVALPLIAALCVAGLYAAQDSQGPEVHVAAELASALTLPAQFGTSVLSVVGMVAIHRGAQLLMSGTRPTLRGMLTGYNWFAVVIASFLIPAAQFFGAMITCGVGVLFVFAFFIFTYPSIVEGNGDGISGLLESWKLSTKSFGQCWLLCFLCGLLTFALALLCIVPSIIGLAVTYIAVSHGYRQLRGDAIAPL